MNRIKKQVVKVIFFLVILVGLLFLTSYLFVPKNNLKQFGMTQISANGILGEKNQSIDVVVIGDSESFTSISPMQLWEEHGFTTYVCGTGAQRIYESYLFLRQALKTQTPKLVILETHTIYSKITAMKSFISVGSSLFPVFKYHNRWKSLSVNDFGGKVRYTWTDDLKGFNFNLTVSPSLKKDHMVYQEEAKKIADLNLYYLNKIIELCQKNEIQFLLVSTPSTLNWNYKKHNGIQAFADANQLEYIDLNLMPEQVPIDWEQDTRDRGDHLNYYGAQKVTHFLGNYLKEKGIFEDHREDRRYAKWNEALKRYQEKVQTGK